MNCETYNSIKITKHRLKIQIEKIIQYIEANS